jgi:hypothetical protein
MTEIQLKELLKKAHDQLDSQAAMIQLLASRLQYAQGDKISAIAKERKRWAREDLAALEIRDLEQQAKGVNDFKKWVLDTDENTSGLDVRDISLIEFYVDPLIRQAKALKEDNQ